MTIETPEEIQQPEEAPQNKNKKNSRVKGILLGVLLIVLLAGVGALSGYQKAMSDRQAYSATQVAVEADKQFGLAEKDLADGKYENARLRYQRVIELNPSYPNAVSRLAEVTMKLSITNTPTPVPTPTLTPTPDTRGAETLFAQARQNMTDKQWQTALDTLDALRKEDRTYRTVDVDGMYFVVLSNLGVSLISSGSLEMGLYDLSLAERFGYLDNTALGLREAARNYITGASFWEVDWGQAAAYFAQVYPGYPNLSDFNGVSAQARYVEAMTHYVEDLVKAGSCSEAEAQYQIVGPMIQDSSIRDALSSALGSCSDSGGDNSDSGD